VTQYLLGDLKLWGDVSNIISIGDRALISHKGTLKEEVKLRKWEGISLILLRDTILWAQSTDDQMTMRMSPEDHPLETTTTEKAPSQTTTGDVVV
jgi:hypothetical protein